MLRLLLLLSLLGVVACSSPSASPAPSTGTVAQSDNWPRQIDTLDGPVTLDRRPERLLALSVGYEEILLALAGPERLAAVSTFAVDPAFSNSIAVASKVPTKVNRDPEAIVATNADVIIAATTTRKELLDRLRAAGVTVLVSPFRESVDELPRIIRWLARIADEDAAGERMVKLIDDRLARVDAIVKAKPESARPKTLFVTGTGYFVVGDGALRDVTLRRAGGRNVAAEAGVQGDKTVGLESIVALDPTVIVTADNPAGSLAKEIAEKPALADVAAIRAGRVVPVRDTFVTILSHYQVRGIEELARALYPAEFAGVAFAELPERF
jgi:iron complex transport system substrate-binding protein